MMALRCFILGLWVLLSSFRLIAQVSEGGTPPSFLYASKFKSVLNTTFIAPPDVKKMQAEDIQNDKANSPYRIAENIAVELNIAHSGKWDTLPSGEIIWQLKIYSPGALGLRLIYNDFYLPSGSRLFVYNESHDFVIGAFTEQNNHPSGMFATEIIPGESCILEYVSSGLVTENPRINISEVGYIYRGMDAIIPQGSRVKSSGSCEVNVNCSPEGDNWKDVKRSVTRIILGNRLCSGTLLNNTARDFKGYISTAFHCVDSIEETAPTWVFYFNYEKSGCSTGSGTINHQTLTGAWIRAKTPIDKGGDGALLEIFGTVPPSYNAYWAGWERSGDNIAGGVCIHHPAGDYKKISTSRGNWYTTTWHGTNKTNGAPGAHWRVVFAKTTNGFGVTEGGSSGSGMFGPDELFRGSLSGGSSDCANPYYDNLYGKLSYNWDKYSTDSALRYKPWLDPINSGEVRILGKDKNSATSVNVYWTSSLPVTFVDSSVQFNDKTIGNGITRTWYFEGGIPATSSEKEPIVYYNKPGVYNVKLDVKKDATVYSKLRTDYVVVQPRPAWILQNTGFPNPLYGIEGINITDSLTVWAWAIDLSDIKKSSTAYTRTFNGGITWNADTIKYAGIYGYGISNLFPLNKDTAYVSLFAPTSTGGGKILRTSDGGTTWQHQATAIFGPPDGFPDFVYFFNTSQGVCMGDPKDGYFEIYTTNNGGNNWSRVIPSKVPAKLTDEYGTTNYFDAKGDTIWFGTTLGRIFRSTNKGADWNVFNTGLTGATDVKFKNSLYGFAIKKETPFTVKKTMDGGNNWSAYTLPENFLQGELANVPHTNGTWVSVVFNDPSGSSYSIDNGLTFTMLESGIPYTSVAFYNARIGWAGSYNTDSVNGGIYKWNYDNSVLASNPKAIRVDPDSPGGFYLYPNPVSSFLHMQCKRSSSKPCFVELFTLQGSKVSSFERKFYFGEVVNMDMSLLKPGLYILRISGENIRFVHKIIKH
jgi:hypothetical protein